MKRLMALVLAALLASCGGSDDPVSNIAEPKAFKLASPVIGDIEIALHTYQALYGKAPGFKQLNTFKEQIATNGAAAWANAMAANFANLSNTEFAALVLKNIQVTPSTLTATATFGSALQAYDGLLGGFRDYLSLVGTANRGVVTAQLAKIISNLEVDTQFGVYGGAAFALNTQMTANVTYSTNAANVNDSVVQVVPSAISAVVAPFQGNYSVVAGALDARLAVDPTGKVTCTGRGLVVCSGQVAVGGLFTVSGNDGLRIVDTTATLSGNISSAGNVTGSFTVDSVSGGRTSGSLTGRPTPTPTTTTTTTTPTPTPTPTPTSIASYQGKYIVSGGGISASFTVDSAGKVSCTGNGLVVCAGQVAAGGAFTIAGNDGLRPIDTTAALSGSIDSSGNITGSFTANSVSDGRASGSLTGRRATALTPTPGVRSLTRITISPDLREFQGTSAAPRMLSSRTGCVTAIGTYSDGSTNDITASVVWSSSQTGVATTPSVASVGCALITGYIVAFSEPQIPMWPLGISAAGTVIKARDPGTGIEGNLTLSVERGLDEGTMDIPLQLGGVQTLLRPLLDGRAGFTSSFFNGSNYVMNVKPLGLYHVWIYDHTMMLRLRVGGIRSVESCDNVDLLLRGYISCIARADAQGRLPIDVVPVSVTGIPLSRPATFRMSVREFDENFLVNVGSFAVPVLNGYDSLNITADKLKPLTVGSVGCSYYSFDSKAGPQSVILKNLTAPASVTLYLPDLTLINDSLGPIETRDYQIGFDLPDQPRFKTIIIRYCAAPRAVVGTYYGSSAAFFPPGPDMK